MAAGPCQLGCRGQLGGSQSSLQEHRVAEGKRARLVEDNMRDRRDPLQGIAGGQVCALAEEPAGGDDLDERSCERDGAGTGDDQNRNGDEGRVRQGCARDQPAYKSQRCRDVDLRHIEGNSFIGDAAIGGFLLLACLQQARDVSHQ